MAILVLYIYILKSWFITTIGEGFIYIHIYIYYVHLKCWFIATINECDISTINLILVVVGVIPAKIVFVSL